jgi:ABC-type proline/glycine betaine transport system permease subunit
MLEAGRAFGSTKSQLLFKVQLPLALPTIMAGINQTVMMALSMVVICSMIGAGGLGDEVLIGINQLQVGRGFTGGIGIVILAIIIDRLTQSRVAKHQQTIK